MAHPSSHIWLTLRLPWRVNKTLPERLCNDINNSSYSLPDEKKLRMDRTGKRPVSLQACSNQNENKLLLIAQSGMLSSRVQAPSPLAWPCHHELQTWGSSGVSFISVEIVPTRKPSPGPAAQGADMLRAEELTYTMLGSCIIAPCLQKQHLVMPGTGFRLDPPLGFTPPN